jgi:ribonuclease P protein component
MARKSRRHRLTGRGAFDAVLQRGRRRDGDYVQVMATVAALDHGRTGLIVGKRTLARAVDRNRVRRMLRAVLAHWRPELDAHDVIVRLKRGVDRAHFPVIVVETERLLGALTASKAAR